MVRFAVFNELSLPFQNDLDIVSKFISFFNLLGGIKNKGLGSLRISKDFKDFDILPGIHIQQFLGQQQDIEFRRRLISFLANGIVVIETPIIKEDDDSQKNVLLGCEYFHEATITDGGLACCDVWSTLAISFNSEEKWDTDHIVLQRDIISPNGTINQDNISILHSSRTEHLISHNIFFEDLEVEIKLGITQENLWLNRDVFFPSIVVFSPEVKAQIAKLDKLIFQQAMNILRAVETKRKRITDFNHSGEGKNVKKTPKLREMRTFTFKKEKVFFEKHIKSFHSGYRMYFIEQDNNVYIGYIGKHLEN